MSQETPRRGSAAGYVQQVAIRFAIENVGVEPTDKILKERFAGRPLPTRLLEPIRKAVIAYRKSPEYADWQKREAAEREAVEHERLHGLPLNDFFAGEKEGQS